jgi:hypothetical protein
MISYDLRVAHEAYFRGALQTVADAIEKHLTDGTLKRVQR